MDQIADNSNYVEADQFEKRLKGIFTPIEPDSNYVRKLKDKLFDKTAISLETDRPGLYFILAILGLVIAIIAYFLKEKKSE